MTVDRPAPPLGRYVTVTLGPDTPPMVCHVESQHDRTVVLRASRPLEGRVSRGGRLRCSGVNGGWEGVVREVAGDRLTLDLPDWLSRASQRRHRRVPCDQSVELAGRGVVTAARFVDLSLGGASLLAERSGNLVRDQVVELALPAGAASGRITSVRNHTHPRLCVVGLTWVRFDLAAGAWIGQRVAEGAARLRSGSAHGAA
jgi:hypothetical protein